MASQEDSRSASEFQGGRVTRRGFIGHIGGLYTAITITGGTAIAVSFVKTLTDRHAAMWDALGTAAEDIDYPTKSPPKDADERQRRYDVAAVAEQGALRDLLSYRPTTLEENAERLTYLRKTVWDGCAPQDWEWELLLDSMSA